MTPDGKGGRASPVGEQPRLAPGFLAALPLFVAYELGLAWASPGTVRAPAEALLGRILLVFGENASWARLALLAALGALAHAAARREGIDLRRAVPRQWGEGCVAGVLLGPLLVLLLAWLGGASIDSLRTAPRSLPGLLRLIGAAPWEELLFRVAAYGFLFLIAARSGTFLGLARSLASLGGDLFALLGSALAFAAFHLDSVQRALGSRGEPFHPGVFLWRLSAGILLGALFRWRGLGVSAWAHAVFNVGIALFAG